MFLFICLIFCSPSLVKVTREGLLNIRLSAGQTFFPVFIDPESFSELLVRAAAALYGIGRRSRLGKRAGAIVKLRQRGLRTALPSIHLPNVHSLANKMDKLLLLNRSNMDFCRSAALCFTETWLGEHIPDSSLHLLGFQLLRGDRTELPFYSLWEFSSFILVGVYIHHQAC